MPNLITAISVCVLAVVFHSGGSVAAPTITELSPPDEFLRTEFFDLLDEASMDGCNSTSNLTLSFANVILTHIGKNFLSSPLITCLELQNLGIHDVSARAFDNLPNLKFLNLTDNNFPVDLLSTGSHQKLETLILDYSDHWIKEHQYYSSGHSMHVTGRFPSLKKLFMRNRFLNRLTTKSSNALPSLTHLDLSANKIEYNDFEWLPQTLEYLNLAGNPLESLTLRNLKNLSRLTVDQTSNDGWKKVLSVVYFENLNGLKYFSAIYNGLDRITRSTFNGRMDVLTFLRLSHNTIEFIENGTFDKMPTLQNLYLDNNKLDHFPLVNAEMKLRLLSLNKNKIMKLPTGMFGGMSQLKILYLHDNEISHIERNAFASLDNLEILTLSNNHLKSLPSEWMLPMLSLKHLDLEENGFSNLEDLSLSETSSLLKLYFQSNPLKMLKAYSFDNMPENVTIHLDLESRCTEICGKI